MRDLKVYFTGIMSGKLFRERGHSLVLNDERQFKTCEEGITRLEWMVYERSLNVKSGQRGE